VDYRRTKATPVSASWPNHSLLVTEVTNEALNVDVTRKHLPYRES
jgi:hypothetical protein